MVKNFGENAILMHWQKNFGESLMPVDVKNFLRAFSKTPYIF